MIRPDSRLLRVSKTFTGASGNGAAGTVAVATLTGRVIVDEFVGHCTNSLTTTGVATIALGSANNTGGLIAATTATTIDTGFSWVDTGTIGTIESTRMGGLTTLVYTISESLIYTIASADINGGTLDMYIWWRPLTSNGNLA